MVLDGWREGLWPCPEERNRLLRIVLDALDRHVSGLDSRPVGPGPELAQLTADIAAWDFATPRPAADALASVLTFLEDGVVHAGHPRHFGLFHPAAGFPGQLADLITAAFNPQLALRSQAPLPVEMERAVVREIGRLAGFDIGRMGGHFTSGGSEANHTALLLALTRAEPGYAARGLSAFRRRPLLYASEDSHLAWLKIAHHCGLGRAAVRLVPCDAAGRLDLPALARLLDADRREGAMPALLVATAGTPGAGMIDPIPELADLADRLGAHLHVDAAWAGACLFSPALRASLAGIERADSVTIDAHKWLSVPMGAGMFLCRERTGLRETFAADTGYMPQAPADGDGDGDGDAYANTLQWSRRFIGLKLFLSLAVLGHRGYAALVEESAALGRRLRSGLTDAGWWVLNDTALPVLCFADPGGADPESLCATVNAGGEARLSTVTFGGRRALRAGITSFRTRPADIDHLLRQLDRARQAVASRDR